MLRLRTADGWWLVTHPDHARLAGDFASRWGNERFVAPQPRAHVLRGIYAHDDGWRARDEHPVVTKAGKPSAFSSELVGAYSAFEEIDLEAYLAVRRSAVGLIAKEDAYAAILISMHTYNLLSERADRSTIQAQQLPLLDAFLAEQRALQQRLQASVAVAFTDGEAEWPRLTEHFRLLQATDNLSLLSCVDYAGRATLLHPLPARDGAAEVQVERVGERSFRLTPYPFDTDKLTFAVPARFVPGDTFASSEALQAAYAAASTEMLTVHVSA